MPRLAIGVAYQGGDLHGWQRQAKVPSVQQILENALSQVAASKILLQAAGRTDAGVHATGQVAHFDSPVERPDKAWLRGVNSLSPPSVAVQWVRPVSTDFHARFSATERRYLYLFASAPGQIPGFDTGCWHQTKPVKELPMHQAAQCLLGEHDFTTFRGAGCQANGPFRRIHRISVRRFGQLLVLDVAANAFLLHMVRNIAGALIQVGLGEMTASALQAALEARNRGAIGATAPPQGLYLHQVRYPGWEFPAPGLPPLLRALNHFDLV